MIVVVLAPFARAPRRIAMRWLAYPIWARGRSEAARAERARALIAALGQHRLQAREGGGDPGARLGPEYLGPVGRVLIRVCPPLLALLALCQAATGLLLLFASVPVALLWRSRRYLADATAVELTRNPDGLHGALGRLGEAGGAAPGGEEVAHLFVIAPPPVRGRSPFWEREGLLMGMHPSLARRLGRLARMGAADARARSGT
jgi:Zn-dependent protease with chaperone function